MPKEIFQIKKMETPLFPDHISDYRVMNDILSKVAKAECEFYEKIAEMCLGRKIDYDKDRGRFGVHIYEPEGKTMLVFDNMEVGQINKDYINFTFDFIPNHP